MARGTRSECAHSLSSSIISVIRYDTPEDLEPIHKHLIRSYERVLPAYDEIIEAANSEDLRRMSAAARKNLPRIEGFNEETRAILQDLEQAATSQ